MTVAKRSKVMTNKECWVMSIIITICLLIEVSVIYALAYNFTWFADALNRSFGVSELADLETFIERIHIGAIILPVFFRGFIELIPNTSKQN